MSVELKKSNQIVPLDFYFLTFLFSMWFFILKSSTSLGVAQMPKWLSAIPSMYLGLVATLEKKRDVSLIALSRQISERTSV